MNLVEITKAIPKLMIGNGDPIKNLSLVRGSANSYVISCHFSYTLLLEVIFQMIVD